MPGITYPAYPPENGRDHTRFKAPDAARSPGHPHTPHVSSHYDSFGPPMTQTTAYGVNGPQWTVNGPPPVVYNLSPYARVPLPPLYTQPATIHPLLVRSSHGPASSIWWDICHNPVGLLCSKMGGSGNLRDQYHWKALRATDQPELPSLVILINPFLTPLVVRPSSAGIGITVWDVLAAIYAGARRGAAELRNTPSHLLPPGQPARGELAEGNADDELAAFVREAMGYKTRFAGLVPSTTESNTWILVSEPIVRSR